MQPSEMVEKVARAIGAALDRQGYALRDDDGVALADIRGGDFVNVTLLAQAALSAALTAETGFAFAIGQSVEKFTGEAIWHGVIVARYRTTKGKERYVVEVQPQGFQMIAVPDQLRSGTATPPVDRKAVVEECAKVADEHADAWGSAMASPAIAIAAAIRKLGERG